MKWCNTAAVVLLTLALGTATSADATQRHRWWHSAELRAELGLTEAQSAALQAIFQRAVPDLRRLSQEIQPGGRRALDAHRRDGGRRVGGDLADRQGRGGAERAGQDSNLDALSDAPRAVRHAARRAARLERPKRASSATLASKSVSTGAAASRECHAPDGHVHSRRGVCESTEPYAAEFRLPT